MTTGPVQSKTLKRSKKPSQTSPTAGTRWLRGISVALFDALIVLVVPQLVANGSWTLLTLLTIATLMVNYAYVAPWARASRWLTPGLILMVMFVAYPVIYTTYISFTNWRTGNILTKDQVLEQLESRQIQSEDDSITLDLRVYRDGQDQLAFLVFGPDFEPFLGVARDSSEGPLTDNALDGGVIDPANPPEQVGDFTLLAPLQVTGLANRLETTVVDLPDGSRAETATLNTVTVSRSGPRFTYDPETDVLTDNQLGLTCPGGEGNFFCGDVPEELVANAARNQTDSTITCAGGTCDQVPLFALDGSLPGWRAFIGPDNYLDVLTNERIRQPFLRVFTWNVVFATVSVVSTFALGLGLALALQDEAMRGRPLYRSIYMLPYAIPAFLTALVWRGLLNAEFGQINGLLASFGIDGPNWLGVTGWAMAAVLIVNLWLGFPYMFLITSGALTSIPSDLLEAARVDGAGPWRSFRSITLPLLLVSTAPLLIGSFAFNFNNVVLILLLTGGGPPLTGYDVPVGGTDILISFTFNLAQGGGRGQQFGLATAIIVMIFLVLAVVSSTSFRLTKRLEEIYAD